MQQANSPGLERWAKIFNLKEMAKTLLYLQEHSLMDYAELEKTCDVAVQQDDALSSQTKAANDRMKEIAELQKHIGAYLKTREVYAQYRSLPSKKQEGFYAENASSIISCEAATRYFDSLGLKKLPTMQSLKQEYAALSAENKKLYPEQKKAKAEMMELLTAKHNTMRILDLTEQDAQQGRPRKNDDLTSSGENSRRRRRLKTPEVWRLGL